MNERTIFDLAIEIHDPVERAEFLSRVCAPDRELRARIEALLQSHMAASTFLNQPAIEQALGSPPQPLERTSDFSSEEQTLDEDGLAALSILTPSPKPGSLGRLAHYEVLQQLGHGGFGTVLKAFDEKLHRLVAIKVMSPQLAATSPPRKRFLREARAAAAIKHENIVQVYSVEEQPLPYLVMELIEGQTLQQKLDGSGPLEPAEIIQVGRQIARGLAAAHATGLIHRDIKPGNILLEDGPELKVKITDFGLARASDDASLTQTGIIAGTPMYMAPEQAMGQPLDHRADLFSLGSVLYQMASGRPPFRAASAIAVLRRVAEDTPRPLQEILPNIPDWLVALIGKLHAKVPAERFQSAQEVADLFGRCEAELQAHGKGGELAALHLTKPPINIAKGRPHKLVRLISSRGGVAVLTFVCGALLLSQTPRIVSWIQSIKTPASSIASKANESINESAVLLQPTQQPTSDNTLETPRKLAEAILRLGGKVSVNDNDGISKYCTKIDDLPSAPLRLCFIDLSTVPEESIASLPDFSGIDYLPGGVTLSNPKLPASCLLQLNNADFSSCILSGLLLSQEDLTQMRPRPDLRVVNMAALGRPIDRNLAETIFSRMPNLLGVNLQGILVTDEGAEVLARQPSLKSIISLNTTSAGLSHLAEAPRLRKLQLTHHIQFDDTTLELLARFPKLELINIYSVPLPKATVEQLQDRLPNATVYHPSVPMRPEVRETLTWLIQNKATVTGWKNGRFGQRLTTDTVDNVSLQEILFPWNEAPPSGAERLTYLHGLEHLRWPNMKDTDAQAEHLAKLSAMNELSLPSADITAVGLGRLTAVADLDTLNLASCREVSEAGWQQLTNFRELRQLELSDTLIDDSGLAAIRSIPKLENLKLMNCRNLTSDGMKNLIGLPLLRKLHLGLTPVDDRSIQYLKQINSLRQLTLSNTGFTKTGIAELQQALPKCAVFINNTWLEPTSSPTRE